MFSHGYENDELIDFIDNHKHIKCIDLCYCLNINDTSVSKLSLCTSLTYFRFVSH